MKKTLVALGLLAVLVAWCLFDWYHALPADAVATYVGRASCIECHQVEYDAWHGSDHDRAMELASDESIDGDFNDTSFTRLGVTTRFFRRGDEFWVNTEGPDGEYHDYQVKWTFGVRPLQQYMVELDRGRVQVLRVSWDVEKEEWFYVPPPDAVDLRLQPDDPLHWTGMAQNWNTMCAECHSTDLQKNFDLETNSYNTTYEEIDVSCEACHGPGSIHVQLAEANSLFWDRRHGYGTPDLAAMDNAELLNTCAPCHSRRGGMHGGWVAGDPFLDYFKPSLLEPGLYHADGQILDEVYVYASFLQSKMYHEGVKCTDCHDAHSLERKFDDNRLCGQCHDPERYDRFEHTHHTDPDATLCINCHMLDRPYMARDWRRDHSFRIPRPDMTVELGTPNTCNDCHTKPEEDAAWCAEANREWYGDIRAKAKRWAPALAAARAGQPEAVPMIADLMRRFTPDIVRATAIQALAGYNTPEAQQLCREALDYDNPLVRAAALESLSDQSTAALALELASKLKDPSRLVRNAAAERLVNQADRFRGTDFESTLRSAIKQYREGQEVVLDRAPTHMRLAMLHEALGETDEAIESFATAVRLEPYLTGPRTELARLMERRGGDQQQIDKLREEEVGLLLRDCNLLPDNPFPRYRLGMLLFLLGRNDEAIDNLVEACRLAPDAYDFWLALALLCEREERWDNALTALQQMNRIRPNDPNVVGIYQRMQQARARAEQEGKD